ncbi:hypothetical protein CTAYLR_003779 [Chrysophaeum taylorii]|uniref:DUF4349 domain-containing protein n=1 Tax=Chrysophaeum taylorii TaxID=2483200 RepID=A0AAD7XIE6_9STRA|nr:hypothetical protein CTAYLR_003779 [Chrysophaeum taylorii]
MRWCHRPRALLPRVAGVLVVFAVLAVAGRSRDHHHRGRRRNDLDASSTLRTMKRAEEQLAGDEFWDDDGGPSVEESRIPNTRSAVYAKSSRASPRASATLQEERYLAAGDRMLVKRGAMTLETPDVAAAMKDTENIAIARGGYVVSSSTSRYGTSSSLQGEMVLRVPSDRFEEARAALATFKVLSEATSTDDVTAQYVDAKARAQSLQATHDQLVLLMERATRVEDVLAVQKQLATVDGNLEAKKATVEGLEKLSAMSTINLSFREQPPVKPPRIWSPDSTVRRALYFWTRIARVLIEVSIYLVIVGLPILTICLVLRSCVLPGSIGKKSDSPAAVSAEHSC